MFDSLNDVILSVANYFSNKDKTCIQINNEYFEKEFSKPFKLVTYNDNKETDGVIFLNYEGQIEEIEEARWSICAGLDAQYTWICFEKSMLDYFLPLLDPNTGILLYQKSSERKFKITEYRKADRMHEYFFPEKTFKDLIKIQNEMYWKERNYAIKKEMVLKILNNNEPK